jgi:organic hydroperoxide reductase OsmC/OhrA
MKVLYTAQTHTSGGRDVPGVDRAVAQRLVEAHQICPYSKATRGNIDVAITVV